MDPIRFSVERPVTVSVGVLLVLLFGLIAIGQIPIQLTPNIETTVISVRTAWEGATPEEIKNDIIIEQEDKLKGATGLKKMIATAGQGEGTFTLEFQQGITKEMALREVSDKLRQVPDYPENVDEPVVEATNPQDRDYIAWVVFSCTDPDYDIRSLQDFLEDRIKPEIERVEGIAEVNVIGGLEREVHVRVSPERMAALGITPKRLLDKLRTANRDASGGALAEGKRDIRIRSVGRFGRLDQIENTLLSEPGVPAVRVRDVASVELGYKKPQRLVRNKGRTVVALNAQREVGANVVAVMEQFKRKLHDIETVHLPTEAKRLGIRGDFHLEQVYDQTIYIHQAVDLVLNNLWVGGTLAVIVLLIFLRSVRTTGIIALAIPTSVIGTFLVMVAAGRSLNVVSLAGLAFAVGMVVDNAIVVLENIDRHMQLGEKPYVAAYRATREVWGAILASTLTTLCVFIPVLTIHDEAGQLFRDISIAICGAVALSLIVSITVIPAAASRWLRQRPMRSAEEMDAPLHGFFDALVHWPRALVHGLRDVIAWLNRTWALRLAVIAALIVLSVGASIKLMPPTTYLPPGNRNLVFALMSTPPGTNLHRQMEIGSEVEHLMRPYWEAAGDPQKAAALPKAQGFDPATGGVEEVQPAPVTNFFFVVTPDRMFMGGISEDDAQVQPLAVLMNQTIQSLPAVQGFAFQRPLFTTSSQGAGDALELEVGGPNLEEVNHVASILLDRCRARFGRAQTNPSNFDKLGDEVQFLSTPIKDARAADVALSQDEINAAVQLFGDGAIIGDYLFDNDTIDLKVLAADGQAMGDATYMARMPVATPIGRAVTLDQVRDVRRTLSPEQIIRVEAQGTVTIQIQLDSYPLEQAIEQINADIAELRESGVIPPTVTTIPAGSAAKLTQVKEAMLGKWTGLNVASLYALINSRMFLALLVVFLLMVALFENWFYPLVIMVSVPLATVGGFLGLAIVHYFIPSQQLDMLTMLGFVILMGIVVNNAILIVHQSLNLMRGIAEVQVEGAIVEKLPPHQAIAEAVRTRVRPIFMTTCTSVGGMAPLVLFPGSGSELYRGLGSVVLGGLIVSTIFTLLLVPLLLGVVFDVRAMFIRDPADAIAHAEAPASHADDPDAGPTASPAPEPIGK